MNRPLSYSEALGRYPEAVAQVLSRQRAGRGQHREAAPEALEWSLDWSVRLEAGRQVSHIEQLLSGETERAQEAFQALPLEERVARQVAAVRVMVMAKKGRGRWYSEVLPKCPSEIVDGIRQGFLEEERERERFQALPPEAQEAEVQALMGKLRGSWTQVWLPAPRRPGAPGRVG